MKQTVFSATTTTLGVGASEYYAKQKDMHDDPAKYRGLKFGFPELDKMVGGALKKMFIIVAGAPKLGKTTWGIVVAERFAHQVQDNEMVLYISLEMGVHEIVSKIIANVGEIEMNKFRDVSLEEKDWVKFAQATDEVSQLPLLVAEGAYTIEEIEHIVDDYASKEIKIRAIVLDYFQLMSGDGNGKRWEQLETLSRGLKQLAMQKDLSIIALSQQTKEALQSVESSKDPLSMAGTQALLRDCDLMMIILPHKDENSDEEISFLRDLYVARARNSQVVDIPIVCTFNGTYCRFGSLADPKKIPYIDKEPIPNW